MRVLKVLFVIVLIAGLNTAYAQQKDAASKDATGENFAGMFFPKESSQQKLEVKVIEDFENCESWAALMPSDQGLARGKKVLGAAEEVKKQLGDKAKYVFGVKEWSYNRGFSWVEITPPTPIAIVGKAKGISIWACGRNYRHRLEIWLKNYQGYEYPIDMGSLNFRGWEKMTARIPMYIPYYTKYVPQYRPLYISRILIKHDPNEMNGTFYIYLDQLEAIVDTYEDKFDGDDMINEMGMERWEEIPRTDGKTGTEAPKK
ncbi:MAG: flagellar filament outer layer protein FlaA [bacterium]|nr:flagellar filament outer layer protein FlaA [bacterium]